MSVNYEQIFAVILSERNRQNALKADGKFPHTCADMQPDSERLSYLAEEFGEVAREVAEITMGEIRLKNFSMAQMAERQSIIQERHERKNRLAKELVQTAAICVAWLEGLEEEDSHS